MKRRQTLSGFLRQNLDSLEAQLYAGIRQDAIVEELAQKGFITTVPILRVLLHRARKRAGTRRAWQSGNAEQLSPRALSNDQTKPPPLVQPKENPLTKSTGFEYGGKIDPSDLI